MKKDIDFTNTPESLLRRLLELQPVKVIKQEYDLTGNQDKVIKKIIKEHSREDIIQNFLRNFGHCKQHVYFLRHNEKNISNIPKQLLSNKIEYTNVVREEPSRIEIEYLTQLNYHFKFIVNQTATDKQLRFYWPVKVVITKERVEVRIVIMERKMRSTDQLFFVDRDFDEETIVREVCSKSGITTPKQVVDITKGIKTLWKADIIDAPRVEYRKSSSLTLEKVDPGKTFKRCYPAEFKEVIKRPLRRMAFYSFQKNLPYGFICDPELGYLAFSTYEQENSTAIDLMIDNILNNN